MSGQRTRNRTPLETLRLYPPHDYTIPGAIQSRASNSADRPFLVGQMRTRSWREFQAATIEAANFLLDRGIRMGDRVAIFAQNSELHVILLAAMARIRAIMVPTNPEFGANEAGYVFEHAQVDGVICDADLLVRARQACQERSMAPWFATSSPDATLTMAVPATVGKATNEGLPDNVSADDTCLIIYTSGTSGFPKGVMHSQRSFLLSGEAFLQRMHLQPEDRLLILLPLFHINALFYSVSGAIATGCAAIIGRRFSASNFWRLAVETGATQVSVIEAMGTILASRPRTEYDSRHSIRKVYGVRPLAAKVFREEFGIPDLISGFGMTEVPGVLSPLLGGENRPGSMGVLGRHPDPSRPWSECRILDDERRDVAVNEIGELAVKTPNIMQGYFRDAKLTAESFHDGWFLTGDLVRRDADGFYFFVSRKKDIIRRRGENIAGAELDRVIGEHPDVYEAAAIPVPSELGEDDILVAVVPRPGATLTAENIAAWCGERLAAIKVPRYVLFLDELPHTPTHKVAKNVLKADATVKARAIDRLAPTRP